MGKFQNESTTDRIIRAVVGVVILVVAYMMSGALSIVMYIVAIILLVTAITGFCALYKLFDFTTKKQ